MRRLVAVGLLAAVLTAVPGPVLAQGADAQGWWWTAAQPGAPAPPAPPDVAGDDLLVQGGDVPRLAGQPAAPTAVAALRFVVPDGAGVDGLSLAVGAGARLDDLRAYVTTSTWVPTQGGPLAAAPAPDVSRYSAGHLSADGATLVFPDIGRLVTEEGVLSLVLEPGPTDRAVLHHPGPAALAVTPAPYTPAPGPVPAPVAPPPVVTAPLVPVAPLALPPPAPAPATQATPAPVVAQPVAAAAVPTRAVLADDSRTRLVVVVELVLLLLTFGLLGQGPLSPAARLLGPAAAVTGERGIGRYRSVRSGVAPRL